MSRNRGYCFTLNNWTWEYVSQLMDLAETNFVTYIVIGFEICPKTGTPHLQGYMHFPHARSMQSVHDRVDHIALIIPKAEGENYDRRYTYCMKDIDGGCMDFWESGDRPVSGANTSTTKVVAAIKEGKTIDELAELFPSYMIHHTAKVKAFIAMTAIPKKTKFYVVQWNESLPATIQYIQEYFNGPMDNLAVVVELRKLAKYKLHDNIIFFSDEYDHEHTLWPIGDPISYTYGYEERVVNCDRFILVTKFSHLYPSYKKINI